MGSGKEKRLVDIDPDELGRRTDQAFRSMAKEDSRRFGLLLIIVLVLMVTWGLYSLLA